MPQGITDLDRMPAQALLKMHAHAVAIRDLVAQYASSGPLRARADLLIEDIEAARAYPTAEQLEALPGYDGSASRYEDRISLAERQARIAQVRAAGDEEGTET